MKKSSNRLPLDFFMDQLLIDTEQFTLSSWEFFVRLLVSIGIGVVIGLERQYSAIKEHADGYFGIRTFTFYSLLGCVSVLFYFIFSPWIYIALFIGMVILTAVAYWQTALKGDRGLTTEVSALLTFILGSMAAYGLISFSLMLTVIVVVLLSSKFKIKTFVGKITTEELYAFIRFVVLALLIFPFLPDKNYGPYEVLNPREIGWVVLLTSALGFSGYILIKTLGNHRGILLGGLLGGLVSSTSITWVYAKKSKVDPSLSASFATAILGASSILFIRVGVWTALFHTPLFRSLVVYLFLLLLTALGVTFYTHLKGKKLATTPTDTTTLSKPLDLISALVFGGIYLLILLAVSYANNYFGDKGTLISSALAGISDIDAVSISIAKLTGISISLPLAEVAILIACLSNTLVKLVLGCYLGSPQLRTLLIRGYGFSGGCCLLIILLILFS
ncbi:MAG: hypothetical protein RLZZ207_747 [Bacteroidota bacterium]